MFSAVQIQGKGWTIASYGFGALILVVCLIAGIALIGSGEGLLGILILFVGILLSGGLFALGYFTRNIRRRVSLESDGVCIRLYHDDDKVGELPLRDIVDIRAWWVKNPHAQTMAGIFSDLPSRYMNGVIIQLQRKVARRAFWPEIRFNEEPEVWLLGSWSESFEVMVDRLRKHHWRYLVTHGLVPAEAAGDHNSPGNDNPFQFT